ncbi:MAG: hypothetical protein LBL90_13925 [Prevotellaceae bacterium]|jgi:hypothetical protein|nr:hypothetical protein [Prevotellaceae bacterium]
MAEQISMQLISDAPCTVDIDLERCKADNEYLQKAGWMVSGRLSGKTCINA